MVNHEPAGTGVYPHQVYQIWLERFVHEIDLDMIAFLLAVQQQSTLPQPTMVLQRDGRNHSAQETIFRKREMPIDKDRHVHFQQFRRLI